MQTPSMTSRIVYPVIAVVGIAAASAGAWWYQSRPQGPNEITASSQGQGVPAAVAPAGAASGPRAAGVEVAKVERARLQDDAQSVGSLRSRQSVMLRPEVPGRVRELGFADGARVRKGQLLVQLDDTLQRAEIKQAQAQVSIATANLKRNQELVAQSFVTQRVLDESNANLQVAEAQLALACARWSRMAILAPFDGTVGLRIVNLGDFVKDGADLVNLEDISSMYADFRLPERFQGKLRLRQSVQMQLDAFPGRVFKATVEAIDPLLDVNGRSVGVRAVLPNTMGEPMPQAGGRPGGTGGAGGPGAPGGAGGAKSGAAGAKPSGANAPPAKAAGAGARPGGSGDRAAAAASGDPARRIGRPPDARPDQAESGRVAVRPPVDANGCPLPNLGVAAAADAGGRGSDGAASAAATGRNASGGASRGPGGAAGGGNPAPLRPGMFARVTTIFAIKDQAIVVPEEAIVPQGGRQFVIKVVDVALVPAAKERPLPPDTKLVSLRQEVKLGVRQQGRVEILEGLVEGETVVVAGQQRLQRDGTALRVVELGRPPQRAASGAAGAPGAGASGAAAATAPASAASNAP